MFGKNYDKEIKYLYNKVDELMERIISNKEEFKEVYKKISELSESLNEIFSTINKVTKSHKEAIKKLKNEN